MNADYSSFQRITQRMIPNNQDFRIEGLLLDKMNQQAHI